MTNHRIRSFAFGRIVPAVAVAIFAAGITALPASASTLGTFKATGQVAGTIKATTLVAGVAGVQVHACQDQQTSSPELILQLPKSTLSVNGKSTSVSGIEVTVEVSKDGDTEAIDKSGTSNDAQVSFVAVVAKKIYQWTSTSGSINVKGDSKGGSFTAGLVPLGSLPGGSAAQSGGASKPMKLTGSWTSCHAFAG